MESEVKPEIRFKEFTDACERDSSADMLASSQRQDSSAWAGDKPSPALAGIPNPCESAHAFQPHGSAVDKPDFENNSMPSVWKKVKLEDIANRVTRKNENLESDLPLTIASQYGLVAQTDFFNNRVASCNIKGYYLIKKGEFAYNKSSSDGFPYGSVKKLDDYEQGVLSTLYIIFSLRNLEIDSQFLAVYYNTNLWHSQIAEIATEGARNHGLLNISANDFMQTTLSIPFLAEQQKIGKLFASLDSLIALHQRKCEKLKNVKKALLEKMFPAEGCDVPEIRFKEFTDAWGWCGFNGIANVKRGLTYNPTNVRKDGIRVLRSSNINEEYFTLSEDDVFVTKECVNIPYVKNGDILITSANGSSNLVGKHTIICGISDNSTVHGGFMLTATTENPSFLNASMSSNWYKRFIDLFVAGGNGAIGNLNKNDLDNYKILIPEQKEQQKIGKLFSSLDNLITLHDKKVTKLKQIKQALLNKMFI